MVCRTLLYYRGPLSSACLVALFVLISAESGHGQVVLNEVLASNRITNLDEDGDSSDWLELYNAGSTAADLKGYSLTDDRTDLRQWLFPETSLAPGAYLLVWCSGKDRTAVSTERIVEQNSPFPFDPGLISLDTGVRRWLIRQDGEPAAAASE